MERSVNIIANRRISVWAVLIALAAVGWAVTVHEAGSMSSGSMTGMQPTPVTLLVFLPIWAAMMVAMMFPAVSPVVSLFDALRRKRVESGMPSTSTALFVAGYLIVWIGSGLIAYAVSLAIPEAGMNGSGLASTAGLVPGIVLIAAGLYQWSPIKGICLRHCRSPLGVMMTYWRDGATGAVRMGMRHGAYCLGCCWVLMVILLLAGLMNLAAMAALSALIFVEKVIPRGDLVSRIAGICLVASGLAALVLAL